MGANLQGVDDDVLRRLGEDPVAAGALADPATIDNLRVGLRGAIRLFLDELGRPDVPGDRALFVLHGRLQRASGRGLEEMLAFYRHSSLVIWSRVAAAALARGVPAGVVAALADAVFAFGDELAGAASLGFDEARADEAVAADARRRQLLRVLLRERPADPEEIREVAALARWRVPPGVVVLAAAAGDLDAVRAPFGADALADDVAGLACVVVPDGPRVAARAARAGVRAALSDPVAPAAARAGLRRAAAVLRLAPPGHHVARVADHRADLLLLADRDLAADLAADRLGPLRALPPARRARMLETLTAWLAHPGRPQAMADDLHLHVQTVRYRLGQLRDLLGDALDDPDARFELAVAVRADMLAHRLFDTAPPEA